MIHHQRNHHGNVCSPVTCRRRRHATGNRKWNRGPGGQRAVGQRAAAESPQVERLQVQGTASALSTWPHPQLCSPGPSPQATRQALAERLGRGSRTVDPDLESRLDLLRLDRQRYQHVSQLAQTLANQLAEFTATQSSLGDAFAELGVKTPPLHVSRPRPQTEVR